MNKETNLGRIRKEKGLSQRELAERSEVSKRSIEKYEQREKDINRAAVISIKKLADALGCRIEELIEPEE